MVRVAAALPLALAAVRAGPSLAHRAVQRARAFQPVAQRQRAEGSVALAEAAQLARTACRRSVPLPPVRFRRGVVRLSFPPASHAESISAVAVRRNYSDRSPAPGVNCAARRSTDRCSGNTALPSPAPRSVPAAAAPGSDSYPLRRLPGSGTGAAGPS